MPAWLRWCICIILLLPFSRSEAQYADSPDAGGSKSAAYRREARYHENKGDIYSAIHAYEEYFASGTRDVRSAYRLAGLYLVSRDYLSAKNYYDSVITIKPGKFPEAYYYKGVVCMNLKLYDESIESFEVFRKVYRGKRDPEQLRRQARYMAQNAAWARDHIDSVAAFDISPLEGSVNKPHIEFSPILIARDSLLFGSYIPDSSNDRGTVRKLYWAVRRGERWEVAGELSESFNVQNVHTGNASVSADGNRIYFTHCAPNWKGKMLCSIYVSTKKEGSWQEPEKLPYPVNSENFTSTQPSVATYLRTGEDLLYFVSDRKDGRGGMDIWYTYFDRRQGVWKEPRNAGRSVNTFADECCPFYDDQNQTLYFSSKGHPGFGGYDIFQAAGSMRKYSTTEGFPPPLNSSYDDTYFSSKTAGEDGFFTSNRPGTQRLSNGSCCDDIFYFSRENCVRIPVGGSVVNQTNYDMIDELNERYGLQLDYPMDNKPLKDIIVELYAVDSIGDTGPLVARTTTGPDGRFSFYCEPDRKYRAVVKNFGYFDKAVNFSTSGLDCEKLFDIGITRISSVPDLRIRFNVYYEFDKARLTAEAKSTIDSLLLPLFGLFPNAIIEIGSHTDHNGSEDYNLKLSQRRSESVVNYLIGQGINEERLVAKGYGESEPIAPNTLPDGSDNPEGRQLNRRTELRVIGQMNLFYFEEE